MVRLTVINSFLRVFTCNVFLSLYNIHNNHLLLKLDTGLSVCGIFCRGDVLPATQVKVHPCNGTLGAEISN